MSQAGVVDYDNNNPQVPTSFVSNDGTAVPAANVLNVLGINGIETYVDPNGSNNLYIELENGCSVTGQTVGAVTADLTCINVGTTPGTYAFRISVAGYVSAGGDTGDGCGYFFTGAVRTDGATATIIPTTDKFVVEDPSVVTANAVVTTDGANSLVIRVTGVAGDTIEWSVITNGPFAS